MTKTSEDVVRILSQAGIDDAPFETEQLIRSVAGISHTAYVLGSYSLSREDKERLYAAAEKRAAHYPLQYITGEWDFFDSSFYVGEGVLIPRPETEFIVERALGLIPADTRLTVVDLCAGTGCIGLCVAKHRPLCDIIMIEKSETAVSYIIRNTEQLGVKNASVKKADLFRGCDFCFDVLLTNPPYIRTDEIPLLQTEVGFEPSMALAGGADGLVFYRAIADSWLPRLNGNGFVIAECGEEQPPEVCAIFARQGITAEIAADCFGVERFVFGRRSQ